MLEVINRLGLTNKCMYMYTFLHQICPYINHQITSLFTGLLYYFDKVTLGGVF